MFIVTSKNSEEKKALKMMVPKNKKEEDGILNEIALMQMSEHQNILQYFESYRQDRNIFIVLELMEGNLTDIVLERSGQFPEPIIAYILQQTLAGLNFLHVQHRLHRDIKSDNVLMNLEGDVKLGDFGFAA